MPDFKIMFSSVSRPEGSSAESLTGYTQAADKKVAISNFAYRVFNEEPSTIWYGSIAYHKSGLKLLLSKVNKDIRARPYVTKYPDINSHSSFIEVTEDNRSTATKRNLPKQLNLFGRLYRIE